MKRFWMIILVIGLLAGFALATAFNAVLAQTPTPETPETQEAPASPQTPQGQGGLFGNMMRGYHRGGMMGALKGVMHPYVEAELASRLGLTVEELQALRDEGQTFSQIAEAQGVSAEDAQQMMLDARSAALDAMVADGVITAEQAEAMKTRMQNGGCHGGMSGATGTW